MNPQEHESHVELAERGLVGKATEECLMRLYSGRAEHFWTKGAPILTKIFFGASVHETRSKIYRCDSNKAAMVAHDLANF